MSKYNDAVVWIDRHEAKIFRLSASDATKTVVVNSTAERIRHRADHEDATRHAVDDQFLRSIIAVLDHDAVTLIAGPGNAKHELKQYLDQHHSDLPARITTIDGTGDDGEILSLARQYFSSKTHRHWVDPEPTSNRH